MDLGSEYVMVAEVDVSGDSVLPLNHGPIWVLWYATNYATPWCEKFDTIGHAIDEAKRRDNDSYYPCWLDSGLEAQLHTSDPGVYSDRGEIIGTADVYPVATLTAEWSSETDDYHWSLSFDT